MIKYQYYKGKKYYYFNGVLSRFRESVDDKITKEELIYTLHMIKFPIISVPKKEGGKIKMIGYYNANLIELWIRSKKESLIEKIEEKRAYDSDEYTLWLKSKRVKKFNDNERKNRMKEKIESIRSREEDMNFVSDEL